MHKRVSVHSLNFTEILDIFKNTLNVRFSYKFIMMLPAVAVEAIMTSNLGEESQFSPSPPYETMHVAK